MPSIRSNNRKQGKYALRRERGEVIRPFNFFLYLGILIKNRSLQHRRTFAHIGSLINGVHFQNINKVSTIV